MGNTNYIRTYRVLRERSAKQYQKKKLYVKLIAILEIEGATGS